MENIKFRHTFGFDIYAEETLDLVSNDDFVTFLNSKKHKILLGGGSDVLFTQNFHGLVGFVKNTGIEILENNSHYLIKVAAGENWHNLIKMLVQKGIGGLENLALIPGTCGAAPVQNIGAYGSEFKDFCDYVEIIDDRGEIKQLSVEECQFEYRSSIFKNELKEKVIIISIGLKLNKNWMPNLSYGPLKDLQNQQNLTPLDVYNKVVEIRKVKIPDPKIIGSAGSFFKNPIVDISIFTKLKEKYQNMPVYPTTSGKYKLAAGWLIDQSGLKGYCINDACVYERQALILVNKGNATPSDVCKLAKLVINQVQEKFGITLHPEVRIIGSTGEIADKDAF